MMIEMSYLVPFDDLFEFLIRYRLWDKLSHVPGLNDLIHAEYCNPSMTNRDSFEKLHGTWWEVSIPACADPLPRCIYVADSLRDALRLKPGVGLSPSASSIEMLEQYLDEAEELYEENAFLDSAIV